MKEQIHTIPINDALDNAGECLFCYIERRTEEHVINYVLGHGASYMEADIRDMTDKAGFCRCHFKKMFDYGNALGNAWILKTHYRRIIDEMNQEFERIQLGNGNKSSNSAVHTTSLREKLFSKTTKPHSDNSIVSWINEKESSCFICDSVKNSFDAYLKTFFTMYQKDADVRDKFFQTKGVCLSHMANLLEGADTYLSKQELQEFYAKFLPLQTQNMERIYEDISWFIEKYDYKNKDADWKDSKTAVQRGMMKLKGTDPSLPPYQLKR